MAAKPGSVTIEGTSYEVPLKYSMVEREGVEGGEKSVEGITFTIPKSQLSPVPDPGTLVVDDSTGKEYSLIEHSSNLCHWLIRAGRWKN